MTAYSSLQLNLFTTATLGTEESGHCGDVIINPLSPKIQTQILQTDLHTFLLRTVERIWFNIKALALWSSI